jgi:hypothetical protein
MDIRNRIEKWLAAFGLLVSRRQWFFILGSALAVMAMVSPLPQIRMSTLTEGLLCKEDRALMRY